jgi:hypothetical protein
VNDQVKITRDKPLKALLNQDSFKRTNSEHMYTSGFLIDNRNSRHKVHCSVSPPPKSCSGQESYSLGELEFLFFSLTALKNSRLAIYLSIRLKLNVCDTSQVNLLVSPL